jgi:sugar phosphate isomerase/epimerase
MSKVDLFLQSYCYRHHYLHRPDYDVFTFLDRAAADGYTGVSINMNGPNYRQLSGTSPEHIRKVRDRLEANRLRCDIETSGTDEAHLTTILKVCEVMGVEQARTYMRHDGTPAETVARTIADLRRAAPMYRKAGIALLLENHEDFTGAELATIMRGVACEPVGALFDYGNSMMVAEQPETALEAMLPFIRSVHLKDHACRKLPDGTVEILGVPIGSGVLPIADLTQRLVANGLDRILLSNVWAYRCPVRDWRGGAQWGEGVFRGDTSGHSPMIRPWDAPIWEKNDVRRLLTLEEEAIIWAQTWLRQMLKEIGVAVVDRGVSRG